MTVRSQNNEFDALLELTMKFRRLEGTMVVDDDYPQVRHEYEGALAAFVEAMKENDRFKGINRYGLMLPSESPKFQRGDAVRATGFKKAGRPDS